MRRVGDGVGEGSGGTVDGVTRVGGVIDEDFRLSVFQGHRLIHVAFGDDVDRRVAGIGCRGIAGLSATARRRVSTRVRRVRRG
ncbi:MAG: hypothetical protein Q605_AUC01009G0003 [Actinomyces urogenitalis DORA_12]|uniref:Uncharacterized protein n=1 Tax=Actinomyces urogenitalis DORA_12 TaxID=1403939 RepID=W1VDP2_9ACTO|nr:MAG: hypothetical protein Q605_AUC01009G0003 [Actinomyces urogenitalis DORA_12]